MYNKLNIDDKYLPAIEDKIIEDKIIVKNIVDDGLKGLNKLMLPTSNRDWKTNLAAIKNAVKTFSDSGKKTSRRLIDLIKDIVDEAIKPHNENVKKLAAKIAEKAKVASTNVINAFNNRQSFFFSAIRTTSSEFKSSIIHVDRMIGRDPSKSPDYEAKAYLGTIANVFDSKKSALEKKRQKAGPRTNKRKRVER